MLNVCEKTLFCHRVNMVLAKTYQGSSSIRVNQQICNLLEVNVFVHTYMAWKMYNIKIISGILWLLCNELE
jgi:hypothetical protein